MDKPTNLAGLFARLKRNTDGEFYNQLIDLLNFRIDTLNRQWPKLSDPIEINKLQGRTLELAELLSGLTRKKVESQPNGGFGQ